MDPISDRAAIAEALADYEDKALRFVRARLRVFGDRNYRAFDPAYREHLQSADVAIYNWAVDRVAVVRRLREQNRETPLRAEPPGVR